MSSKVKGIVLTEINTLLSNVSVNGTSIPYFADYFGEQSEGIYIQSYQQEADGSKHHFGNLVTIELSIFSGSIEHTTAITGEVQEILKASVDSTLTLSDGWQATYTEIPLITSTVENNNGEVRHRDTVRMVLQVDEKE
jgi:hypothetical protein